MGCGNICGIYFENLGKFKPVKVLACADIEMDRAKEAAARHHVPKACTVDELLADSDIEIVVNLTIPKAHATVNQAALEAGKHVYTEKPLAEDRDSGAETLALAERNKLLVGSAPDTVLGAGIQTCRQLIEDGVIGEPVGANGFMMRSGPEEGHPSPEILFEKGGGPLFDMGPYYLTAFVNLIGPVRNVGGAARVTFPQRTIKTGPRAGHRFKVETPTYIVGVMEFENGAIGELTTTFDVWGSRLPNIEIYGTDGTLSVPDPNGFGGKIELRRARKEEWEPVEHTHGFGVNSRGLGVMDMAYAIRTGRPMRTSGALAYHVLDIMQSFLETAETGCFRKLGSGVPKPAPMPAQASEDDLGS